MPVLILSSSFVITAPPLHSLPVPETVTIIPSGNGSKSITPGLAQKSAQMSPSYFAPSEIALQQSITLPPPTARIKSALLSLASLTPSSTLL